MQHFAKEIREAGEVTRVKMVWTDARSEARYEEQKTFDPSLPVFADVLPHIFSILETLMPGTTETTTICDVKCFEQSDHLNFLSKNVPLHVELARNSGKRVRSVEVETKSGLLTLDFSVEPGVIRVGATQKSAAPNWIEQKRPLATMIEAFLKFVDGETRDSRFDLEHVLLVQSLVDQIRKHK